MAKKNETQSTITIAPVKTTRILVTLAGDTDLILCKKARSFEREEMFKQSHPKGTKIPAEYQQPFNMWEKLITSIHWQKPIEFHDDDYSLYTQEEWEKYMRENTPVILGKAFKDSLAEAFKSCGYKDATGKAGTDFARTMKFSQYNPVTFAQAYYDQHLAMTKGLSSVNVLTTQNCFSGWKCELEIEFLPGVFPMETLVDLITTAGKFIGVGSRRKEEYGRYHIESIRQLAE